VRGESELPKYAVSQSVRDEPLGGSDSNGVVYSSQRSKWGAQKRADPFPTFPKDIETDAAASFEHTVPARQYFSTRRWP
jgi:hypothetical protein